MEALSHPPWRKNLSPKDVTFLICLTVTQYRTPGINVNTH